MIEVELAEISTLTCPKTALLFPDTLVNAIPVRIHHPTMNGALPPGDFPLVVFNHGNGQQAQNYPDVLNDLAARGLIVANIADPMNTGAITRSVLILCAAESFVDDNALPWIGSGRLDGRAAFAGHSTGGGGAFRAAVTHFGNPGLLDAELIAVATLAPTQLDPEDMNIALGPSVPAFFVLQGSGDGDTSGAAFSNYDRIFSQLMGSVMTASPRKALVWVYDVEHSEYGGRADVGCAPTPKGVALAQMYFNGFLTASFFEDPAALSLFYGPQPPLVPADLAAAFPEILVFGSSSERVDPQAGYSGYVIDGFENGDVALSDSGLVVESSRPGLVDEDDLREGGLDTSHLASAAFIRWKSGDQLTWNLDVAAQTRLAGATSLVFRVGALDFVASQNLCLPAGAVAPTLFLRVEGKGQAAELDLSAFGRLEVTDTRQEVTCTGLEGDGCHAFAVMQTTFRVPLQELCADLPGGLFLSQIERLSLRFEGTEGIVILDDLEIRSVPGEPDVACHCPP